MSVVAVLPVMIWSGWLGAVLLLWLAAGAVAWCLASIAEADLVARRAAHRQSNTPSIGGRRLIGPLRDLDPNVLLQLDLALTLHAKARMVNEPRRGHHIGNRITYETGLRDMARQWARSRALPIRRGDFVARQLVEAGVIRRVQISQAIAWRLAQGTADDAIRALEQSAGPLVDWTIGPDPDWAPVGTDHSARVQTPIDVLVMAPCFGTRARVGRVPHALDVPGARCRSSRRRGDETA